MISPKFVAVGLLLSCAVVSPGRAELEIDTIPTANGDLRITFIGHGTLMFEFSGTVIHVDPVGRYADYSSMPKADIVLVTHEHGDHLDQDVIGKIATDDTKVVLTEVCQQRGQSGVVMKNGDVRTVKDIRIQAVPAYNIVHVRSPGKPFHPKWVGNGYVITLGDKRIYVAGDTENIPEMAELTDIDVAFLPMNLPYTMTPEMVSKAAKVIRPAILYPYHFGDTDTSELVERLKDCPEIEVRIRKMQ